MAKKWIRYEGADWKDVRGITFLLSVDTNSGIRAVGRRLQRHFAVFSFPRLPQPKLEQFYSSLVMAPSVKSLTGSGTPREHQTRLSATASQVVRASVDLHCRIIKLFTAAIVRSHYSFGKCDLDVLFDNLRMCEAFGQPAPRAVQLWTIECHAVYGMRLATPTDTERFWEALRKSAHAHFGPILTQNIEDGNIPM